MAYANKYSTQIRIKTANRESPIAVFDTDTTDMYYSVFGKTHNIIELIKSNNKFIGFFYKDNIQEFLNYG